MRSRFLLSTLLIGFTRVAAPAEFTGRVVNDNKAVVGATVAAIPYETRYAIALREIKGEAAPLPVATAATAADGRFKLIVPATAPLFVVRASFGGLAPRTAPGVFEKNDAEDLGELSLGKSSSISGRIVDGENKPIAGALVRVGRDGVPTTTSKEGLFRFEDLEARGPETFGARSTLSVRASGFEIQSTPERSSGAPVSLKLKPSTARLAGALKDANAKPAIDAVVRVVGDVVSRWVRTDGAGRFEIVGAPPNRGRLQALGKDGSSLEMALSGGATTFTLQKPAAIEGRVTRIDNGRFVGGAKIEARAGGAIVVARSGPDGRYRLPGLTQGTYRLNFDEKTYVLLSRRDVELAAGEMKTMDIALTPAVTLIGRVVDEKGQPVAGARGTVGAGSANVMAVVFRTMNRERNAVAFVSGVDGTFKASRLAPGVNQQLIVTHADFEQRTVPGIDLIAGAPKPVSVEVVLSPGFVLSGVVKDKDGVPISGAEVALNRSIQMMGGRGGNVMAFNTVGSARPQAETDFEGKFAFKGLSEGDYDVVVSKAGFTRGVSNGVKTGSAPLDIVLNPGASIVGRIVQTNGAPASGYSVSSRVSGASQSAMALLGPRGGGGLSQVDPDGSFVLDGLIPGTAYDLSLFGPGEGRGEPKKKNVVAPASDVGIEVASRGRIAGRVVDAATGAPLTEFEANYSPSRGGGGMQVVIRRGGDDDDRRTPFSSSDGAFAFDDIPPGNWDVRVWAKTYQEARTSGIAVVSGETKNVEVKASRGLVIRGRVVDQKSGRGVQDATVSARDGGRGNGGLFIMGPDGSVTDADGRFEILDQGPGSYQVTARHPSFSEGTARVSLDDKDGSVEIPLASGGSIAGIVTSSQGAPLAGAEVSLQDAGEGGGGIRFSFDNQSTLTDGWGRFRFEHLAAGRYKVSASLRTENSPVVDVPLNAGDVREDIKLSLNAGATIRGAVSGLPESERGGLMVGAQGPDYFANVRTNPNGTFTLSGVPTGTITLRATAGDMIQGSSHTAMKEVTVAVGQAEVMAEIVFEDGLSISGTVTRRGVPVSGARVSAFMSAFGRQASARTDESGAFRIVGLEAGRVTVSAFAETFSSTATQTLELKSDMSIDLVIPTARFGGSVVDAGSGLPLESTVELQATVTPSNAQGPQRRMNATTDTSGRFAFDDLEPVEYRVTARRSGYESVTKSVKPSDAGEDLRLELKRGTGLSIEARDAQMGFGLRSLFVRVQEGANDVFAGPITLDGEGKGEIPGLPGGSYVVTAQTSGYAPVRIPNVLAPSTVLRLAFSPGGAVEFRTTEEFLAGGPKTGQLISLAGSPIAFGMGGPNSFRLSRLNQRIENLSPGAYRLTLDGGIEKTFEVTEGGLAVVTIP